MELRTLTVSLLAAAGTAFADGSDLQLVPKSSTYKVDGVEFPQVAFQDGSKLVTYCPPKGWTYSGSANVLKLRPDKTNAEATISRLPGKGIGDLDEKTRKTLLDQAVADLPGGSTNVQIVSAQTNPLLIDRKDTFMIVFDFLLSNQGFKRSIILLNQGPDLIRFQLTCGRADFDALQKAF